MNFLVEASNISFVSSNESLSHLFDRVVSVPGVDIVSNIFSAYDYCPWIFSLLGSILVGLSGVFPLLVIPIEEGESLKEGAGARRLRVLLSFAVGGLLGDVFLHLLPEAWEHRIKLREQNNDPHSSMSCGLWVLCGILAFVTLEKVFTHVNAAAESAEQAISIDNNNVQEMTEEVKKGKMQAIDNNNVQEKTEEVKKNVKTQDGHHIAGYLNLMANSIDNFTHGLAIGGSFCISFKVGVFSTFAILVHEIPHEVGDFAILLKSGFSRWEAAKAQVATSTAGIFGSMLAVICGSSDAVDLKASWIMPFTAGGFLHIALVTVLPELVREESKVESLKQLLSLVAGIAVMALLIVIVD